MMMMGSWPIFWEGWSSFLIHPDSTWLHTPSIAFQHFMNSWLIIHCGLAHGVNMVQLILWACVWWDHSIQHSTHANLPGIRGQFVIFEMWYGPSVPWTIDCPSSTGRLMKNTGYPRFWSILGHWDMLVKWQAETRLLDFFCKGYCWDQCAWDGSCILSFFYDWASITACWQILWVADDRWQWQEWDGHVQCQIFGGCSSEVSSNNLSARESGWF